MLTVWQRAIMCAVLPMKMFMMRNRPLLNSTVLLIRPDHHVAARWRGFDAAKIRAALRRCTGLH